MEFATNQGLLVYKAFKVVSFLVWTACICSLALQNSFGNYCVVTLETKGIRSF